MKKKINLKKSYRFVYTLEVEADTKEEAMEYIQLTMHEDSLYHPTDVGELEEMKQMEVKNVI